MNRENPVETPDYDYDSTLVADSEAASAFFQSQGIATNRHRTFSVSLTGPLCYALLKLLEDHAIEQDRFSKVRALVFLWESLKRQLVRQGF